MNAATAKTIGLLICMAANSAFAEVSLPKCILFSVGHCSGTFKYSNGDTYVGEFNYGKPNGNGKMTYFNGDLYIGSFLDGQKHGSGDYTWADGNKYIGSFFQGALDGRGAYYFYANKKVNPDKYIGEFRSNSFNGDGVYTFSDGGQISGKFKDGKKIDDAVTTAIAEAKEKKLEHPKLGASSQVESAQNKQIKVEKEKLDLAEAQASPEIKKTENPKLSSDSEMLPKVSAETNPDTVTMVPAESTVGLLANFGISLDRYQLQSKLFVSGSMNSVGISVANVQLANDSVGNEKINATPKNMPFSLGLGYNLGTNYGLELGFKYHGEQKLVGNISDDNFYKSSSLLFGAFFDYSIYSGIGLTLKGGIQNTDTVLKVTSLKYLGNGQYDTVPTIYSSSSNVSNGYYGLGINYAVNKDNKIFIDWTRVRSGVWNYATPPALQDVNMDITEFGFKHTF